MSLLASIGLFAAVVTTWIAISGPGEARPFIAGSALSGLLWTLTIGLGAFFVGPSLIVLYDDVGRWTTITALVAAGAAALFFFMRRSRARGLPRAAVDKPASRT